MVDDDGTETKLATVRTVSLRATGVDLVVYKSTFRRDSDTIRTMKWLVTKHCAQKLMVLSLVISAIYETSSKSSPILLCTTNSFDSLFKYRVELAL